MTRSRFLGVCECIGDGHTLRRYPRGCGPTTRGNGQRPWKAPGSAGPIGCAIPGFRHNGSFGPRPTNGWSSLSVGLIRLDSFRLMHHACRQARYRRRRRLHVEIHPPCVTASWGEIQLGGVLRTYVSARLACYYPSVYERLNKSTTSEAIALEHKPLPSE